MNPKLRKASEPLLVVVLLATAAVVGYKLWPRHPYETVSYPYVCTDCKAIYDVSELKKPGKWQIAPGQGSDSVVVCIRCNKGRAYPVDKCATCGTEYIMHLVPREIRCPKCNPQAAQAAQKAGVDLILHR